MGKRKFKVGDKVKIKKFKIKLLNDISIEKRIGKIGIIIDIESEEEYPYVIRFDDKEELNDTCFKVTELEKV